MIYKTKRGNEKKISVYEPCLGNEELNNVMNAVKSGWVGSVGGKYLNEFEGNSANYCQMKHAIAISNGTAALHIALESLEIGRGDEVIVPDLTFAATANAVTYCNAKPIFVDVHPNYWCIDPERIGEKITTRTKAIIPVHLYGHSCDMDAILSIARDHNLYIIEDCAEAQGAEYKGKKIGIFGDISCFSFYGSKVITTGEGGMCLTNNEELAEKMSILRNHGMNPNKRYWHDVIGFNYRMTNIQAAIGVAQLKKLDEFVEKKREIARWYKKQLKELEEKKLIKLHPEMHWTKCVYWMYCILIKDKFGIHRDNLIDRLEKKGIETRPFFYPVHIMPPYENNERFPVTEEISRKGMNLPSGVGLTKEDIRKIVNAISEEI